MPTLSSLDGKPDLSISMSFIFVHLEPNKLHNTQFFVITIIIRVLLAL